MAKTLRSIEEEYRQGSFQNNRNSLAGLDEEMLLEKFAVRLNLRKSLSSSENLLKHQKKLSNLERENLERATKQLKIILAIFEDEQNPIIFNKLATDSYTRNSMVKLRNSCDKIVSGISKIAFRAVFKDLNMAKLKPVAFRDKFAIAQMTRPIINKGVLKIKLGDFLTKLNLTSGGKSKQFF